MMATMTENMESLILEHLRHIRAGQDAMREDIREIKVRLSNLETEMAQVHVRIAELSVRIDRLSNRVERIETRLGLIEV
jgi:predicted  nucleic acid-binding Zn-ribbon protein